MRACSQLIRVRVFAGGNAVFNARNGFFFFSFYRDDFYCNFFPISPSPLLVLFRNTTFSWGKKNQFRTPVFFLPSTVSHIFFRFIARQLIQHQIPKINSIYPTRHQRVLTAYKLRAIFLRLLKSNAMWREKHLSLVFSVFRLIA